MRFPPSFSTMLLLLAGAIAWFVISAAIVGLAP
jgi:hypothetical protein